jgi:anti-sigma regulatory factor (Ser/Thr protein kinase)
VNDTAQWAEATVQLPEGSVLALFTDGLVEEPGVNLGHGIERLARALDNLSGTLTGGGNASTHDLESVADLVIAGGLAHGDHSDDFALLLVRLPAGAGPSPAQPTSSGTGATTAPAATPPIHAAARRLPATLSSSPIARRFVGDLLREWGVSSDVSATAELLTGELVGNAARNAEAEIEIKLRLDAQRVRVDVFDESHRMPELRPAGPEQTAGRGLMVVNNLSSRWGATVEERGKSVWFELDL